MPEKSKRFSDLDCNERSQGYRIISISCLNDALSSAHQCHGARLTAVDSRESNGLCSTLGLMCLACGVVTKWNTSEVADLNKSQPGKPPFDINRQAAYAISEVGLGRESLATFCGIMGMPLPSETKTWQSQVKAVNDAASDGFANSRHEAAINLRRKLAENDGQIEDFSQVSDVAVSYDGTWHHRGFKSSHGVGVVMAIETGEILDFEILSKHCSVRMKNLHADEEWHQHHAESGQCEKNCEGPSTAMETLAAKALWARSLNKGLRYSTVLSDGDNKTLTALNDLRPYGDIPIEKSDCVNHVHKRMGTGLQNLQKTNKQVKGGKGGLTKSLIQAMSSYYRKAIMDNTTTSRNPDEIQRAIQKMKRRILGNLHHSVYNDDPAEQHKFCDDSWCPYQKDISFKTCEYDHTKQKSKRLPPSYLAHLLPLYERLSGDDLLYRCVGGLTQNQNEAFNATIWHRCAKERAFGAAAVRRAVCLAAMIWNDGRNCYKTMLNLLGLSSNFFTDKVIQSKDRKRLCDAAAYEHKKRDIKRRLDAKNKSEIAAKKLHGQDYQPGMF